MAELSPDAQKALDALRSARVGRPANEERTPIAHSAKYGDPLGLDGGGGQRTSSPGSRSRGGAAASPPADQLSRGDARYRVTQRAIRDRSTGSVVASAVGDALGAPYEFKPPVDHHGGLRMTGGGSLHWQPGEWTDDTQMGFAVLAALAQGDRTVEAVETGLVRWLESGPKDVGGQIFNVLSGEGPLRDRAEQALRDNPTAAGNGGLMRIGPAALAYPGQPERLAAYARDVTALTHAHPDCLDASVLWVLAIDRTIHEAPPSDRVWDFGAAVASGLQHIPPANRARWGGLIAEACAEPPSSFDKNGWVVHAFQSALAVLGQTKQAGSPEGHVRECLEAAVSLGGDTDTVAAITGALVGARWGLGAVPVEWRQVLHGRSNYDEPPLNSYDLALMTAKAVDRGRQLGHTRAASLPSRGFSPPTL